MARTSEIEILSSFDSDRPQSAAEIGKKTGLPRSTVFRALRLLIQVGYLQQLRGSTGYVLGPAILQLGLIARQQLSPEEIVSVPLLRLATQTRETVTFSLEDVPWRRCVYVLDAPSDLRSVAQAGARYGLHLGSASSAILANLPPDIITETLLFHGVPKGEFAKRMARLEEIRTVGAAISVGQRVAGATGVAAPILVRGTLLGAIAVAGPTERMAPRLDEILAAVIKVGADLSSRLSVRPTPR